MCGIAAFSVAPGDTIDTTRLVRSLLCGLESRGRDASGVAWHDQQGQTWVHKDAIPGSALARSVDLTGATYGVVHTRWATQGSPEHEANNHPIDVGGVVGVHNGHIANDDRLLRLCADYERAGEVDSEAAFALIAHGPQRLSLTDRLAMLRGGAALAWLHTNDPGSGLWLTRVTRSPLWLGQSDAGTLVAASTEHHLRRAFAAVGETDPWVHEADEGDLYLVRDGSIVGVDYLPQPEVPAATWQHGSTNYTARSLWERGA